MNVPEKHSHFPACFVELPPYSEGRRAAFYLAAEEYIADTLPAGSYFFTWQLGPTVVMGRNQVAHQEVNLDYCRREGIDVIRRRSGGGAIYADEQNIMTSLITEGCPVEDLFEEYAQTVAGALCQLGAPAKVSGRNDIVLADEHSSKVCGNAFYHKPQRNIAHGTMLYDSNLVAMTKALHPDDMKLAAKGVKSVRSRVGFLKDYLSFDVGTLRQRLRMLLTDSTIRLTYEDLRQIEQLEQRYYEPEYFYGSSAHADVERKARIEGCGSLELYLSLQGTLINEVVLRGDFFDFGDAQDSFRKAFVGLPFTTDSIGQAIREHHPERTIRGLSSEDLETLLMKGSP